MRRTLAALLLVLGAMLVGAGAASASPSDGRVHFEFGAYTAHENRGDLQITIVRSDPSGDEWIGYGVHRQDAVPGADFDTVPSQRVHMYPGQARYTFTVHIYDNGMNAPPVHAMAYLFGSWPQQLASPHKAKITIRRDDPLEPRDDANPLDVPAVPDDGDVLRGVNWYIPGPNSAAGEAAASYRHSNPGWARALDVIANNPGARRFWFWNEPDPTKLVANWLEWTQRMQPGTTVQLSTYSVVHGPCGYTTSPAFVHRYQNWINHLAQGIGNFHVAMFFEIDSLITAGCLTPHQRYVRFHDELAWAINRLERDPHIVVYLDGGAADAAPWAKDAQWLAQAGVRHAQGFFLNATHYDWTSTELFYGQRIARALGGVHFVVETRASGRGPLVPADRAHDGNEVLCNPPGRGAGPLTTATGYRWADAFLWFDNPGGSGGTCRPGAPPTAVFWPAYAVMLVDNAVYRVTGPRYPLVKDTDPGAPSRYYKP